MEDYALNLQSPSATLGKAEEVLLRSQGSLGQSGAIILPVHGGRQRRKSIRMITARGCCGHLIAGIDLQRLRAGSK